MRVANVQVLDFNVSAPPKVAAHFMCYIYAIKLMVKWQRVPHHDEPAIGELSEHRLPAVRHQVLGDGPVKREVLPCQHLSDPAIECFVKKVRVANLSR